MPLPFILGAAAAIAAVGGVGSGIHGAAKMKDANDTMKAADSQHKKNIARFENTSEITNKAMDKLGALELEILHSFNDFSNTIEKIQNRPQFKEYTKDGVNLPKYDKEVLKSVSVGAGVLLGGLGGAAVGTAGGFAAAGATTSAVMALGTASTGTAIASLSGAAATNATLAALGGGALAAGGGGIALGTTILGATTLGVGLLVGGVIFNVTGGKLSDKADEAWDQMKKAEKTIDTACTYLNDLEKTATKYTESVTTVYNKYKEIFGYVSYTVNTLHETDWDDFSKEAKVATQNSVLLVGLLYKMCQVSLVEKAKNDNELNRVNRNAVDESMRNAQNVMKDLSGMDKSPTSCSGVSLQEETHKNGEQDFEKVKDLLKDSYGYPASKKFAETIEIIETMKLVSIESDVVKIEAPSKEKALFLKEKLDWRLKIFVEEVYGIGRESLYIVYGYRE